MVPPLSHVMKRAFPDRFSRAQLPPTSMDQTPGHPCIVKTRFVALVNLCARAIMKVHSRFIDKHCRELDETWSGVTLAIEITPPCCPTCAIENTAPPAASVSRRIAFR